MDKSKTAVCVAGKAYTLVSEDGPEYLTGIAAYVDRCIAEAARAAHMQIQDAAVLTALNLADELNKSKEESRRLRRQITELTRDFCPEEE